MKLSTKIALSLLTLGASSMALAALGVGGAAPDFTAKASLAGKAFDFKLKDALKKGPVVVYFYPSAYTGGCNLQAHTFAINMDKFTAAKATVVGVSLDSIDRLNKFSADPSTAPASCPSRRIRTARSRSPTTWRFAKARKASRTRRATRSATASPSARLSS